EPVEQRRWNLVTRGLRVYLLRVAEDDGTLLKRCADPFELAEVLAAHGEESALVRGAIETLLEDGFLRWDGSAEAPGWLGIDRLVTVGAAATKAPVAANDPDEDPAERRRRLARERKERWRRSQGRSEERAPSVPNGVPGCVPPGVP